MASNTKTNFILSNQDDHSTHKMLDYLMHQKSKYVLLNETAQLKFIQAKIKSNFKTEYIGLI